MTLAATSAIMAAKNTLPDSLEPTTVALNHGDPNPPPPGVFKTNTSPSAI
jgi:hypothetical protein